VTGDAGGRGFLADAAALVWRRDCPGCGAAGGGLCGDCRVRLRAPAHRVGAVGWPRTFAAGPYGGPHRAVVLAAKVHHRLDAVRVLGEITAGTLRRLIAEGLVPDPRLVPLLLLPAPTRPSAARRRGGCVVEGACRAAARSLTSAGGSVRVGDVCRLDEGARDSVGLGRAQRRENLSAALRFDRRVLADVVSWTARTGAVVVVVDDVSTTGATVGQFSLACAARGLRPAAAVVVADA
jgi:predicted amidophosphoribosyltransferase